MEKVCLEEALAAIHKHWSPRVVGELNGQQVKLVKFKGPFIWHQHAREDELFLVISGTFVLELRDERIPLSPGEFFIVPRGVEHRPVAEEEAEVLVFEPAATQRTGDEPAMTPVPLAVAGEPVTVRQFEASDGPTCFRIRAAAFMREFRNELSPEAIVAGVNAYLPDDYVGLARRGEFFTIVRADRPIGFITLRRHDKFRAEIPLIYLDVQGRGIGAACMRFVEEWIATHWPEVTNLFLDTIVPIYNGGFYERCGFTREGDVVCRFPDLEVAACRFSKSPGA